MMDDADGGIEAPSLPSSARQVRTLNRLIVACKDDRRAYREAAHTASDPKRRAQMLVLSRRRSHFAEELTTLVGALGGSPAHYGSGSGAAHRLSRTLKIAVTGAHDGDIFRECARVEEAAAARYVVALRGNWPDEVRSVLRAQSLEIATDGANMRALRARH